MHSFVHLRLLGDPVDVLPVLHSVREAVAELLVVDPVLLQGKVEHGESAVPSYVVTY